MRTYAYSVSRVDTHETCPAKYKKKYIEKVPEGANDAFEFGSLAHKVYEKYLRQLLIRGEGRDTPFAEDLFIWALSEARNDDQRHSVREVLQPPMIVHVGEQVTTGSSWSIESEQAFCEDWAPTKWFGDDVRWRQKVDLSQTNCFGQYEITDFKTSYRILPADEVDSSFQLWAYAATAAHQNPDLEEIVPQFYFLRYGARRGITIQRKDALDFLKVIEAKCRKIDEETKWAARVGVHCGHCSYRWACDEFNECPEVKSDVIPDKDAALRTAESLVKLEAYVKAAKASMKKWIDVHGPVELNGKQYGFVPKEINTCDQPDSLFNFMKDHLGKCKDVTPWEVVTMSKKKVESLLKKHGQATALEEVETFYKQGTNTELKWHNVPKEVEENE